jgi:hypothetical protein
VEGGFRKKFSDEERARVRLRLLREGASSAEFRTWFLTDKVPELQAQARREVPEYKVEDPAPADVDLPAPAAVIEHVTAATTRLFQGARVSGQGVEGPAGVGGPTRTGLTARACRSLQPADEFPESTLDLNVPAADRPYLCVRR